jgi:hypothetical protein
MMKSCYTARKASILFSRVSGLRFRQNGVPLTSTMGFYNVDYLWNVLIQADIVDKEGQMLLEGRTEGPGLRVQLTGNDSRLSLTRSTDLVDKVDAQISANQRLHLAFTLYRRLLHSTALHFGPLSIEYCWVANRLGRVSELLGLRHDALDLYLKACTGRRERLGPDHKATVESTKRATALQGALAVDGSV